MFGSEAGEVMAAAQMAMLAKAPYPMVRDAVIAHLTLGELTTVSVAPAIANAVYHAAGKRIRDLPITIEKLL